MGSNTLITNDMKISTNYNYIVFKVLYCLRRMDTFRGDNSVKMFFWGFLSPFCNAVSSKREDFAPKTFV